ncbi:MAG: peptidoglycan-binding protein, partial [Clostridia bacterium]|nr:peptidoglycan-binding protein [Clostridia bacterium]
MTDKQMAISELQQALRDIAKTDSDILSVIPDGIFAEETEEAVKSFQRKYGFTLEVSDEGYNMPKGRMCLYLALFALSIAIVFRGIPYILGLALIFVTLLIVDRRALLNVDYGLLLTFVFFFIFSGNLARIEAVRSFFASLLEYSTLTVSA